FVEREDDFATVAFWYQHGQPKRFATLPSAKERKFPNIDTVIEGKELLKNGAATGAELTLQKGAQWTGDGQLFINAAKAGAVVTLKFEVPDQGTKAEPRARRVVIAFTHSFDFGIYKVSFDGQPVGDETDFYNATIDVSELDCGDRMLAPGEHTVRLE